MKEGCKKQICTFNQSLLGHCISPLRKYMAEMVTACCMAILPSILRNHLSFKSQNQLSCAALRRNPTNFCLCYLKLLFAAAIPAVTADSGTGLETRTPLQAGTDPALPSLRSYNTTQAQSPQQDRDQDQPWDFPWKRRFPLEAKSHMNPHQRPSFQTLQCSFPCNPLPSAAGNLINIFKQRKKKI